MINRFSVLSLAGELYGIESQGAAALCEAVCLEIEAQMKKTADPSDARIVNLAAALLFSRSLMRSFVQEEGVTSFKAGDVAVSFSRESGLERAEKEIERARNAAAPLLRDEKFYFGQVKYHYHG